MKNWDENFHDCIWSRKVKITDYWKSAYFMLLLNYGLVISVEIISEIVIR